MQLTTNPCRLVALFTCLWLVVLVSRANAQCEFYNGECAYGQDVYGLYDMWDTDNCETCFCVDEFAYMCCSKFDVPIDYEEQCHVFKDKKTCRTMLLDDNGKECNAPLIGIL